MKWKYAAVFSFPVVLFMILSSCSETITQVEGEKTAFTADGYTIDVVDRTEAYIEDEIASKAQYPFFSEVILEKGYRVLPRDAAYYKVKEDDTGRLVDVTAIPCVLPDSDESVAMIYYMSSDSGYIVSSVEYLKEENYDIAHVLDKEALSMMAASGVSGLEGIEAQDLEDASTRFWNCVVKRFTVGCLGCAVKCYLTGPAWASCTSSCCAGGFIVAVVSCAFAVWGW